MQAVGPALVIQAMFEVQQKRLGVAKGALIDFLSSCPHTACFCSKYGAKCKDAHLSQNMHKAGLAVIVCGLAFLEPCSGSSERGQKPCTQAHTLPARQVHVCCA